jgi:two-component system, sensor histidine kinase YesM
MNKTIIQTIFLWYLITNLLLLFILGSLTLRDSTRVLTEETIKYTHNIMEQATASLNFNLEQVQQPLIILANNPSVILALKSYERMSIGERVNHDRNIAEVISNVSAFKSLISDILIVGKNGYINNLDARRTLRWDYKFNEQPWFKDSISTSTRAFISLGLHKQDYYQNWIRKYNQLTLSIAIPVFDYQKNVVGSIICNLDLEKLKEFLDSADFEEGTTFLINEDGTILFHGDPALIGTKLALNKISILKSGKTETFHEKLNGEDYLFMYYPTIVGKWKLMSAIKKSDIKAHSDPLKKAVVSILCLCLLANICISILITGKISAPVKRLLATLEKSAEESLYTKSRNYKYRELNQIGNRFEELMKRIRTLIKQNYLSEIALKESELKTLHSQINPHFLFNTLQLLQTEIVCGEPKSSNQIILSLGNQLRYTMYQAHEIVEIEKELNYIKDYLYIIQKKYDDQGIQVQYSFPDNAIYDYKILKLLLQPIVENSIKHGFEENPKNGEINIGGIVGKNKLMLYIKDNGKGIRNDKLTELNRFLRTPTLQVETIGLYNVNQRIKLKFGSQYGIYIRSKENQYTIVYIFLPKIK